MTAPPPVQDLGYWRDILRNASRIAPNHPDYADARATIPYALAQIEHINRSGNIADWQEAGREREVSPLTAAGVNLMHGLSFHAGEPIAGALSAITGGSFREGAERFREGISNVEAQNPTVSAATDLTGGLLLPVGQIGTGVAGAVKAGVPLTMQQGAALLARGAVSGAVPGAISGFSEGGEDPGDVGARVAQGTRGAEIGAALGALGTGAATKLTRAHVERAADLAQQGETRALTSSRLAESKARLARIPHPPELVGHIDAGPVEDIGQALADFKAGKISQEDLDTALGFAVQPREGIPAPETTPSEPATPGPAVGPPSARTTTPDPLDVPAFQRLGRGKTLPYYPRGGVEEQALPPGPAAPSGPPSHVSPLAPGQLKTLLDLPPEEFEAASGMLSPEMRTQIQALRAGGATGAHVDAAVGRLGAPSFEGGGFQGISEAMAHPTYQQAGTLAARILKDPQLLARYPQFAGQSPEAATTVLQRMLVEHARSGGPMPALTSLPRFLARLAP